MESKITKARDKDSIVPSERRTRIATSDVPSLATSLDNIFEDFRTSFNDLMAPLLTSPLFTEPFTPSFLPSSLMTALPETLAGRSMIRSMIFEMMDKGDHYQVMAELPGFDKEDIDVRVGEVALELRAEKNAEKETEDDKSEARERAYSAFRRAIRFPEHVVPSKVEGTMKNGVLSLRIPKKEPTSTTVTKVSLK